MSFFWRLILRLSRRLSRRLPGRRDTVLHYTGHRILSNRRASRFPVKREADIARVIARLVKQERVGSGYGGLASGSDILFAEALLAVGCDLHVVLACDAERFVASSVAEAGQDWVSRFHDALAAATSVTFGANANDDEIDFGGATQRALDLGEAAARSQSDMLQIAVFDGRDSEGNAGTGPDMARAANRGWRQIAINPVARGRIKLKYL